MLMGSIFALGLAGCETEDASVARAEFPAGTTGAPVQIGAAETPDAAIGRVVAARFTGNGERVVVLDYTPPYVKVFRRDGTLDTAFLAHGGGPLEMRDPAALAIAGDSLILVADGSRRVAVFTMDGQLRGEGRTEYPVLAAASGCDGEWLAYGPAFERGARPSWLHRLRMTSGATSSEDLEFRDALGGIISNGVPYGIVQSGDTTRVWHVLTENPSVLGWACGERQPSAWKVSALSRRQDPKARGQSARMAVEPGRRTLAGMAAVNGGVILAAQVVPKPGQPTQTEFTLVTPEGEQTVAVPGAYVLRDGHPRMGVLVSTTDPVPRLFTISRDDLRGMFNPAP
jgi:hypothetical protein